MNKKQLIEKWEAESKMWQKTIGENALFSTKEQKLKAVNYIGVIQSILTDLKELDAVENSEEKFTEEDIYDVLDFVAKNPETKNMFKGDILKKWKTSKTEK
jgi:hypothetical protein